MDGEAGRRGVGTAAASADTPAADEFSSPDARWFRVVAVDVPTDTRIDDWIAANVPARPELEQFPGGDRHCVFRSRAGSSTLSVGWTGTWEDARIGGRPARLRADCGFVDGVSFVVGKAYVFSFRVSWLQGPLRPVTDFNTLADTVAFPVPTPAGQIPGSFEFPAINEAVTATFVSERYGYTIRHPVGWSATKARATWIPGEPQGDPVVDRFTDPELGLPRQGLAALSALIPDGMTADGWIDQYLPPRRHGSPAHCTGYRTSGLGPEQWSPLTIGGHDGRVRRGCGFVDGVVVVGRRAYVFTANGAFQFDGAAARTEEVFAALLDGVTLHPEAADPSSP